MADNRKRVSVIVMGDIGRSPRMQYHSLSFATEGFFVDIVGYGGSEPIKELSEHPNVTFYTMKPPPDFKNYLPAILAYGFKVVWQFFALFFTLLFKQKSHHIIVQNPPAIPTLIVCWFYSLIFSVNYIIDWHNYGYSIMALSLGKTNILVRFSEWLERCFGKLSNGNVCVTHAMKNDLFENWGIVAETLYDRPPQQFHPVGNLEKHTLFKKLAPLYPVFGNEDEYNGTSFTEETIGGEIIMKRNRPGLIVSSTSWTEDEDFSILLHALEQYENEIKQDKKGELPSLVCVITGKGPLKDYYTELINAKNWNNVKIATPWLHPDDYPVLLASADLGICLHTSSSGLDLPMKVVDMFGCGLPVCAYTYPCLNELVQHEKNGFHFADSTSLFSQLISWFNGFPDNCGTGKIGTFKHNLALFQEHRWHENWKKHTLPLFSE